MHVRDFQAANVTRSNEGFHCSEWESSDWVTCLVGEIGEAANFIKKRMLGREIPPDAIAKELADAFVYLTLLAEQEGVDLEAISIAKFNEVSERIGWPLVFNKDGRIQPDGRRPL